MALVMVFGSHSDPQAWEMSDVLKKEYSDTVFIKTNNPQDVLNVKGDVVILDVVKGLDNARFVSIKDLKKREIFTAHDFDVGYFLKMLDENGIISNLRIIGIPEKWDEETVKDVKKLLGL